MKRITIHTELRRVKVKTCATDLDQLEMRSLKLIEGRGSGCLVVLELRITNYCPLSRMTMRIVNQL